MFGLFSSMPPPHIRGVTLTPEFIRNEVSLTCWFGKLRYAQANSKAVIAIAKKTRDELWKRSGITKWNPTATCTLFASRFVSLAGEQYFEATWHEANPAPALAVADVWFRPAGSVEGHAIGLAMTEIGPLYIDPQVPNALRIMSPDEVGSIFHARFL